MANFINYSIISKRKQCLLSTSSEDEKTLQKFNSLKKILNDNSISNNSAIQSLLRESIRSLIESMTNVNSATKYYSYPIYIIQEINKFDTKFADQILSEYLNRIIPYVSNLQYINDALDRYNLRDYQYESIRKTIESYMVSDRVLKNYNSIVRKFPNIELECKKVNLVGLRSVIDSFCKAIDSYNLAPYKKMNVCIEELEYIFNKNNINYDKKEVIKLITNYFLMESNSEEEINKVKKVLTESDFIKEEDLIRVKSLFTESLEDHNYTLRIADYIGNFYKKSKSKYMIIDDFLQNCLSCTFTDFKMNLDKVLWVFWDIYSHNIWFENDDTKIDIRNIDELVDYCFDKIYIYVSNMMNSEDIRLSKDDINIIMDTINSVDTVIFNMIKTSKDYDVNKSAISFKHKLEVLNNNMEALKNSVYLNDNIQSILFVNRESSNIIPVSEFKLFKFHNLITAGINLDKFLKQKSKKLYDSGNKKYKKIMSKVKNILFDENTNIYSYIGEDDKVDITVSQYYINEDYLSEIHEFLNEVCKEFNYQLECNNNYTSKAYYIINPGIAEVHLKDSTLLKIEDCERKLVNESNDDSLDVYIEQLALIESCLDMLESYHDLNLFNIKDKISKFYDNSNFTFDHYKTIMEALSLVEIDHESVSLFSDKFSDYCYSSILESQSSESDILHESNIAKLNIERVKDNWTSEDNVPFDIQLEACLIIDAILEDSKKPELKKPEVGAKKMEDDSDKNQTKNNDKTKKKKNPFSGLNLNSISLYLEGLKSKMKNMSSKEKEISRKLDNNFTRFVKSLKQAMVSDRREAIIKGSVIPSFSKCIKMCIGLAGLGLVTGNPFVPLVTAIGGFAVSKNLTKKERILLLDEIDTELEVVEKEIAIAESKNQMKKYRTLLKYKKDLQRQYQRIRYNVRVGKDILPNSTAGLKNSND